MPSRRLTIPLPLVPRATTLDVATTVIRLTPDATFNGNCRATLRNGTSSTPPPRPSIEPSPPATAPAAMTMAMSAAEMSGKKRGDCGRGAPDDIHCGAMMDSISTGFQFMLRRFLDEGLPQSSYSPTCTAARLIAAPAG